MQISVQIGLELATGIELGNTPMGFDTIEISLQTYCHNPNSTSTQLKSWVRHENDFSPPTTTHTNSMSSLSQLFLTRFLPNFKGRYVGSTTATITTTGTTTTTTTTTTRSTKATFHLLLT